MKQLYYAPDELRSEVRLYTTKSLIFTIYILVTPERPNVKSYIDVNKCIVIEAEKEDTGKCDFYYNITLFSEKNVRLDVVLLKANGKIIHCKEYNAPVKFASVFGFSNISGIRKGYDRKISVDKGKLLL